MRETVDLGLVTKKVLDSAVHILESSIVDELTSDTAQVSLDHVIRALRYIASLQVNGLENVNQLAVKVADIYRELAVEDNDVTHNAGKSTDSIPGEMEDYGDCMQLLRQVNNSASSKVHSMVNNALSQPQTGNIYTKSLRELVRAYEEYYTSQDPDSLSDKHMVYRGGRIDRSNRKDQDQGLTAKQLESYLNRRQVFDGGVEVLKVKPIAGGYSKTTVFFEVKHSSGSEATYVIRKNYPEALNEQTVVDEYPLLKFLFKNGFPVAEPIWIEEDNAVLSGSFLISKTVAGSSDLGKWQSNKGEVVRQSAEIMSSLHSLEDSKHEVFSKNAGASAGEAMEAELKRWQKLYLTYTDAKNPLIEMVFSWLFEKLPQCLNERPARIIHGDFGFHNMLIEDGKIRAILDWEFRHLGDPTEDLIYYRQFVEQIGSWEEFYQEYLRLGGASYNDELETYFKVWSLARNAAGNMHAMQLFLTSLPNELKLALAGMAFSPYLELDAANFIVDLMNK